MGFVLELGHRQGCVVGGGGGVLISFVVVVVGRELGQTGLCVCVGGVSIFVVVVEGGS